LISSDLERNLSSRQNCFFGSKDFNDLMDHEARHGSD
jgi:hypothetical protein